MATQTIYAVTGGNMRGLYKSVDFSTGGALATLSTRSISVTITGLRPGNIVVATPRTLLVAGLVMTAAPYISANDTLTFSITNITAGSVTPAAVVFDIFVP